MSALWLENSALRLGVVPTLGGRLLSVRFRGRELLWRNPEFLDDELRPLAGFIPAPVGGTMGEWLNYGGDKTWPAPQGWSSPQEWAGPPDPVLDSGPWDVEEFDGGVRLISGDDPRTGLRLTREIRLGQDASWSLRLTATNTADRWVRWALWNVTQLPGDGAGETLVAVDPAHPEPVVELLAGTGFPQAERPAADRFRVPHADVVGKLGFPGATGTLEHTGRGVRLRMCFDRPVGAVYPDAGSGVQVWMEHPLEEPLGHLDGLKPTARIVECEVLGPLTDLAPGASTRMDIEFDVSVSPDTGGQLEKSLIT